MPAKRLCPYCNVELKLDTHNYTMGSFFAKKRFHTDIYECPKCGEIALYKTETDKNLVKCPVCGTKHYADEACVVCALNANTPEGH